MSILDFPCGNVHYYLWQDLMCNINSCLQVPYMRFQRKTFFRTTCEGKSVFFLPTIMSPKPGCSLVIENLKQIQIPGTYGYLLQYSSLENPTDRGAWRVPGGLEGSPWNHKELDTTERLTLSLSQYGGGGLVAKLSRPLCPWNFPGKNTGAGCHFLLQGIFLTRESNPGLLHYRQILYQLSYKGSPKYNTSQFLLRPEGTQVPKFLAHL